jgi:cytochrome c biogenesis protein
LSKEQNFVDRLWDFFCSLKLAIITLILLALTSILGTVIEQGTTPEDLAAKSGWNLDFLRFLDSIHAFDMYHSWWFLGLMGLFSVNLICCSIKRFPHVWKTVREPRLVADDGFFRSLSNVEEVVVAKGTIDDVRDRVADLLKARFNAPVVTESDGKVHLYAEKGAISRFGVYVTHCSILIIFLGAMIGNVWGYKAFVNILEGSSVDQVWSRSGQQAIPLGFSVRCDDFSVSFYEGSQRPKLYSSDLVIIENGQEVLKKTIVVNDPLNYKGLTFYQASYGSAGDPVFRLRIRERASGEIIETTAKLGERLPLPGGGSFAVINFTQNYDRFGPAVQMQVSSADGRQANPFLVLQNFPDFDAQRGDSYIFSLLDLQQRYYTGLQVAKDPGVWVVWLGCFLMVVGSLGAFFLSHRRLWVTIQPLSKGVGVKLGGSAHRNQPAFALYFDGLRKELNDTLAGK